MSVSVVFTSCRIFTLRLFTSQPFYWPPGDHVSPPWPLLAWNILPEDILKMSKLSVPCKVRDCGASGNISLCLENIWRMQRNIWGDRVSRWWWWLFKLNSVVTRGLNAVWHIWRRERDLVCGHHQQYCHFIGQYLPHDQTLPHHWQIEVHWSGSIKNLACSRQHVASDFYRMSQTLPLWQGRTDRQ